MESTKINLGKYKNITEELKPFCGVVLYPDDIDFLQSRDRLYNEIEKLTGKKHNELPIDEILRSSHYSLQGLVNTISSGVSISDICGALNISYKL
jgi:hypothetical protein